MSAQEYECNQCKSRFNEQELGCSSKSESEVECPYCGGKEVEESDASGGVLDFLREIMADGGG